MKRKTFTPEEKLAILRDLESGLSSRKAEKKYGTGRAIFVFWKRMYQRYGMEGLKDVSLKNYSQKFKEHIVKLVLKEGLPLRQVAEDHRIYYGTLAYMCWRVKKEGYRVFNPIKLNINDEPTYPKGAHRCGTNRRSQEVTHGGKPPGGTDTQPRGDDSQQGCVDIASRCRDSLIKKSKSLSERARNQVGTTEENHPEWTLAQKRDIVAAINSLRQEFPLELLLEIAGMARRTYYYHIKVMQKGDKYAGAKNAILESFYESNQTYGYRRITFDINKKGYSLNKNTVLKLMNELGIECEVRGKSYRSFKGTVGTVAPNIMNRDFKAERPNEKWATDITQINICSQKLYLSPIVDLYNGEIVDYTISHSPNLELVMDMLNNALQKNSSVKGLMIHTDQGWHYQHKDYCKKLLDYGITQSMSRKGNCLDNAVAENFFGRMKTELLYRKKFESAEAFIKALDKYIDFYNNKRIKLRLNGMSPVEYRLANNNIIKV